MEVDITKFKTKYNVKLVLPTNVDRWECCWKNCGLCCITEKTQYHIKNKCSKLNTKTKECAIYHDRLIDCKFYPFIVIFNENGINLSPLLNCPYILSSTKMGKVSIDDVLREEDIRKFLEGYDKSYRRLHSSLGINTIYLEKKEIEDILNQVICINNLKEFEKIILKYLPSDIAETINKYIKPGAYIQPNYSNDGIPNPLVMNISLTKKNHIIFKSRINTIIVQDITIPNTVLINDAAQILLKQYIELDINRQLEFHSMYYCGILHPNINPKDSYLAVWVSILVNLYVNIVLIVLREKANVIDYPMMREVLSMSDSFLSSIIYPTPNI